MTKMTTTKTTMATANMMYRARLEGAEDELEVTEVVESSWPYMTSLFVPKIAKGLIKNLVKLRSKFTSKSFGSQAASTQQSNMVFCCFFEPQSFLRIPELALKLFKARKMRPSS